MKKKLICLLLAAALALSLAACGGEELSGEAAWAALENAETLALTGDLDDVNTFSDIAADEKIVGAIQEKGILNNTMVVSVDGTEQFYYRFAKNDEFWNNAGTTYACCDMDDNVLGYMHLLFANGASYYAFCDAERNEKGYYLDENLTAITDSAGKAIGSVEAELDSTISHAFHVTIKTLPGDTTVDYIDKLAIYWCAVNWLNSEYSYLV